MDRVGGKQRAAMHLTHSALQEFLELTLPITGRKSCLVPCHHIVKTAQAGGRAVTYAHVAAEHAQRHALVQFYSFHQSINVRVGLVFFGFAAAIFPPGAWVKIFIVAGNSKSQKNATATEENQDLEEIMSTALYSISTGRLGNGLARCSARTENGDDFACTTTSEYGAPGSGATGRTPAIRPPLPAQVMHRSRDERFPSASHSHAVFAAATAGGRTKTPLEAAGCRSDLPELTIASNHISADGRLETRSTTTGEDFQRTSRCEVVGLAKKPAADTTRFRHYCTADDWTSVKNVSTSRPSVTESGLRSQRRRYVVTENAGCCPITGKTACHQ